MKVKNPIVWFEIHVDDMTRAQKFYEAVFQIELEELPAPGNLEVDMKMMAFPSDLNGAGSSGALVKMSGINPGGNSTLIYFGSDDCSIEEKRIKNAGGQIEQSKQSLGDFGFMVLGIDTEGNMFGIHSMA